MESLLHVKQQPQPHDLFLTLNPQRRRHRAPSVVSSRLSETARPPFPPGLDRLRSSSTDRHQQHHHHHYHHDCPRSSREHDGDRQPPRATKKHASDFIEPFLRFSDFARRNISPARERADDVDRASVKNATGFLSVRKISSSVPSSASAAPSYQVLEAERHWRRGGGSRGEGRYEREDRRVTRRASSLDGRERKAYDVERGRFLTVRRPDDDDPRDRRGGVDGDWLNKEEQEELQKLIGILSTTSDLSARLSAAKAIFTSKKDRPRRALLTCNRPSSPTAAAAASSVVSLSGLSAIEDLEAKLRATTPPPARPIVRSFSTATCSTGEVDVSVAEEKNVEAARRHDLRRFVAELRREAEGTGGDRNAGIDQEVGNETKESRRGREGRKDVADGSVASSFVPPLLTIQRKDSNPAASSSSTSSSSSSSPSPSSAKEETRQRTPSNRGRLTLFLLPDSLASRNTSPDSALLKYTKTGEGVSEEFLERCDHLSKRLTARLRLTRYDAVRNSCEDVS